VFIIVVLFIDLYLLIYIVFVIDDYDKILIHKIAWLTGNDNKISRIFVIETKTTMNVHMYV